MHQFYTNHINHFNAITHIHYIMPFSKETVLTISMSLPRSDIVNCRL